MSFIKRTARLSLSDGTQVDLTDEDSYKNAVKKKIINLMISRIVIEKLTLI